MIMQEHVAIGAALKKAGTPLTKHDIAHEIGEPVHKVGQLLRRMAVAQMVFETGLTRPVDGKDEPLWKIQSNADLTQPLGTTRVTSVAAVRRRQKKARKQTDKAIEERKLVTARLVECFTAVAEEKLYFTIDDVRILFDQRGYSFLGHDPRLSTGATHTVVKQGICIRVSAKEPVRAAVKSILRGGGLTAQYRSLICKHIPEVESDLDPRLALEHEVERLAQENVKRCEENVWLREEHAKLREENVRLREENAWLREQLARVCKLAGISEPTRSLGPALPEASGGSPDDSREGQ